jgi:heme exporter protein C
MTVVLILGLGITGPDVIMGEIVRILYIHPAVAWVAYVAFAVTSLCSALWLWPRTRAIKWDQIAGASAEIGVVFTFLALVTGSIWGRGTWGVWWTWDARTTSTAMLLFLYLGVLALRGVPSTLDQRARRSSIAALFAFLNVPLVHFSVVWWRTLHQQSSLIALKPTLGGRQILTINLSVLAFTLVYGWLLMVRYRVARWEDRAGSSDLDDAIAARRAEARPASTTAAVSS